jgi:PDZ domain/Aspartyl protease
MKTKYYLLKVIIAAVIYVSITGVSYAQNTEIEFLKTQFPDGKTSIEIPFQIEDNLPVISVSVNGSRPLRLIFDTGSQTPLLYGSVDAAPLALKIEGKTEVRGAGSGPGILASIAGDVTYGFAGLQLFGSELVVLPKVETTQITQLQASRIDGVIGRPVFENFVVELDWEKQIIRLSDPKNYLYAGKGSVLPLTFDESGTPYTATTVSIDGKKSIPVKLLVDTGGDHALSLDVGSHADIKVPVKNLGNGSASGLTGSYKLQTALVRKLKMGGSTLKDVPTSFIDSTSDGTAQMGGRQGLLGSAVLRRFKVIFDYSRSRMILEPKRSLGNDFEYSLNGFRFTRMPETKTLKLYQIIDGSPAKRAGLLIGDEILSINGRTASEYTDKDLKKMFRENNNTVRFAVMRNDKRLVKIIKLKRFL